MQTLPITRPCAVCGQPALVRCVNCQQIVCVDHLIKIKTGGQEIAGLCGACEALYASNPACYGPLNRLGAWTAEERQRYSSL